MGHLRLDDYLPLFYLAPLLLLFPLLDRNTDASRLSLTQTALSCAAILALSVAGGVLHRRKRPVAATAGAIARDLLVLVPFIFIYENIGVFEANFTYDALIVEFNTAHLGFQAYSLLALHGSRTVSDLLALVYLLFLPLSFGYGIYLYHHRRKRAFRTYLVPLILTHYVAFVFFVFFPIEGPRYFLHSQMPAVLEGRWLAPINYAVIEGLRSNTTDCFPSMHTATMVHLSIAAYYHRKKHFPYLLGFTLLTVLSCVYLWYHYLVDIVAGVLLAFLSWWYVSALEPELKRRERETPPKLKFPPADEGA